MSLASSLPSSSQGTSVSTTPVTTTLAKRDDYAPRLSTSLAEGNTAISLVTEYTCLTISSQLLTRPPGLEGISAASFPMSKPGHSKESSATSPLLMLTPNSSVDGTGDWLNAGSRSSPFMNNDIPPIQYLQADSRSHPEDIPQHLNDLDLNDKDQDGLLGFDSLHERSISSAGQQVLSGSPMVTTRAFLPLLSSAHTSDFDRPRTSRDRPPLSHSYSESGYATSDRISMGANNHFVTSSGRSVGEGNNLIVEGSELRSFGAIGRPELRQSAADYDPNRRRSSSQDNTNPGFQQHISIPEQISAKFRPVPHLASQIQSSQQRRVSDPYNERQKNRHIRSVSQPGLPVSSGGQQVQLSLESHYFHPTHIYSDTSSLKQSRSPSVSPSVLPQGYDGNYFDKGSNTPPTYGSTISYGGYSTKRRDALDYHQSSANSSLTDDMPSFGGMSPSQAYNSQMFYPSHIRQSSEGALLPPASLSHGSSATHSSIPSFFPPSHFEDDLADQLVGEHIDFPDTDDALIVSGDTFFMNQATSHPLLRNTTHSHSMSLDAIPSQYMDAMIHHRSAASSVQMPKVVHAVKFKRSQRNFVLGPRIGRDLKIGTYVKVEADRGEDLGIVVGRIAADKQGFSGRSSFSAGIGSHTPASSTSTDLKRIIRLATHDEVSFLSLKRDEEEELLNICRRKVRERCLPMNVVDAEYQFDRHKLTFFFEAEGRVDFRELVRDLFSMYKTRIWMQQLDKNTATSAQAIIAPLAANLHMDFGTPIIAPPSEFADSIILNGLVGFDTTL